MGRVILFSIKEAAYKALHPILGRRLDFSRHHGVVAPVRSPDLQPWRRSRMRRSLLDVRCSMTLSHRGSYR